MFWHTLNGVVDLGSRHIKAVKAAQVGKSKFKVYSRAIVDTPSESHFKQDPQEDVDVTASFGRVVAAALKEAGLMRQNVLLEFPNYSCYANMVTLPAKMTEEEVEEQIVQEIKALLPPEANEGEWYIERKNLGNLHANTLIMLAAVKRYNVLTVGGAVQDLGTNPIIVDIGIFNAVNVLHDYLTSSENLEKNIAVMDFGHKGSAIAVYKQGKLTTIHTRTIGTGTDLPLITGGRAFTRRIMEHFKLSEEEAEEYKKNEVFFLPEFVPEQDKIANYQVIKPVFGELVKKVFSITEHYVARFREFKVDEIILVGGGANFSNIDVVLGGHLSTDVKQGADLVSIVDESGAELSASEKNILIPAIGGMARES